jgi:short-subunit dehydrogenase
MAIALANMGANLVMITRNETNLIEALAEMPTPDADQQHTF